MSVGICLAAEILEKEESDKALLQIIEGLREDQLGELQYFSCPTLLTKISPDICTLVTCDCCTGSILKYVSRWNQNGRHSHVAQSVLATLLKHVPPERLLEMEGLRALLEGLIPYTERHFQRLQRLEQVGRSSLEASLSHFV